MKDERAVSLPIYYEKQHFSKWILLLVIASMLIPFIMGSTMHVFPFNILITSLIPSVMACALILLCNLRTEWHPDGFRYKFFPFHLNWHLIRKEDIVRMYIRKYSPLKEFGGWGIRGAFPPKAYNTKGNMGIQFELKSGRKILFGTQKPEEWEKIIKETFAD